MIEKEVGRAGLAGSGDGAGQGQGEGGGSLVHLDWRGCSLSRVGTGLWGNVGGGQTLG